MAINVFTDAFRKGQFDASTAGLPVNFVSDTLGFLLVNNGASAGGDATPDSVKRGFTFESSITDQIGAGGGYTTRGVIVSGITVSQTASVVTITTATNPTWPTSTITAYGGWLAKRTGSGAATSPLVSYYTFGGTAIISTGGNFVVQIGTGGLVSVSGG